MRMGNAAAPTPTDSAPQGASSSGTPSSAAPARAPRSAHDAIAFKRELTGVIPHLRAFARGLCGRPDLADDLVQETLLKAWAAQERFEPGTSMRAWTFVILRNAYLTDMRRNRFRADYDETVAERVLVAPAGQEGPLHLSDMHRALLTLPPNGARRCCWWAQAAFPTRKPRRSASVRWARSRAAWAAPVPRCPR